MCKRQPRRWFRFWAKYGFAHAVVEGEKYVFAYDLSDVQMRELAGDWAENTQDGQAILATGYRRLQSGFERVKLPPEEARKAIVAKSAGLIAYHQELLESLV